MPQVDNKRVAKNAIALTLRMVLVTIVGLYTSRIVLEALGIDDYGIYGVVGGVVGMASFLNAAMAGATSRFITFELGKGNIDKLKNIFSTALIIHFAIAIVVMILGETAGLWFLNNKMVIPPERMFAANVLYQFTIISVLVGFTQVPYSADIIAHEKMNIYAYFEIINVVLKLVIVYILLVFPGDRLIFYAGLSTAISIFKALFYRWYCLSRFQEARFSTKFDKKTAKDMLKFSGYDLYGNMCVIAKTQGQPIVLNLFWGVVANAASSIALTVTGAIGGLTTTVYQAFRPQLIKQYASGNIEQMSIVMRRSIQFTVFAFSALAIPFIIETPIILFLWLGQIPEYTVVFIRLILVQSMLNIIIMTCNAAIHATGNIKRISFISGTLYLISPCLSYLLFKFFHVAAYYIYIIDVIIFFIISLISIIIVKIQITEFKILDFLSSLSRSLLVILISTIIVWFINGLVFTIDNLMDNIMISIAQCIITALMGLVILFILTYLFAFNNSERNLFIVEFKKIFHRLKKGKA